MASVSTDTRLADAVRDLLIRASEPVALGELRDQGEYVLVPAYAIDALNEALAPEPAEPMPYIRVSPDMKWGVPVIRGHRLGAEEIADRYWHQGEAYQAEILDAFELTRSELLICCWYTATHGSRAYGKRWKDWAAGIWDGTTLNPQPSGWWGPLDAVSLPPHKQSTEARHASGAAL